jgi:hypothetical protein
MTGIVRIARRVRSAWHALVDRERANLLHAPAVDQATAGDGR